jgi:hypothetical protein
MSLFVRALVAAICIATTLVANAQGWSVPATFADGRIFVSARPMVGAPIVFYTDSGGGFNAISADAARRLGLASAGSIPDGNGAEAPLVAFPSFAEHAGIPRAKDDEAFHGNLVSVPAAKMPFRDDHGAEGFLGGRWFANRIWELDYPRGTMRVLMVAKPADPAHRIALGFQTESDGRRTTNFARLTATIDGESLDLLLDTGATAMLADTAAPIFGKKPGESVGASFISKSVFDRWVARHPDWRVIDAAESLGGQTVPMIEVPQVSVAGLAVGPVWFSLRGDSNFADYMSKWMDRPIVGALGGSGFKYFRITIDYPHAVAWFEIPQLKR